MENKEAICISIEAMGRRMGISRSSAFALAHTPGFPTVTLGRRILVPVAELEAWLSRQAALKTERSS
jgi:predicted DNA-binding transcriptional regulator AlpA